MKVGLYTTHVPASLGGGFVLRDDVARAAIKSQRRHPIELVGLSRAMPTLSKLKIGWDLYRDRPRHERAPARARLMLEVERRKIDLLWFNNFDPIYIGVPYVLNIFDFQHRVSPGFPEVSAAGQWEAREAELAHSVRKAARVTVGSEEAKEQLCHFYGVPPENVWVFALPYPAKSHRHRRRQDRCAAAAGRADEIRHQK